MAALLLRTMSIVVAMDTVSTSCLAHKIIISSISDTYIIHSCFIYIIYICTVHVLIYMVLCVQLLLRLIQALLGA